MCMSHPSLPDEFDALESRLQEIVALCSRLHVENQSLKEQQNALVDERAKLIEKNDTARSKVEQMIIRLKSLEGAT